jgi:hypothetical protein
MRGPIILFVPAVITNFLKKPKLINLSDNAKDLPPHLINLLPNASKEFIHWFIGFVDAEGCFCIHSIRTWTAVGFSFTINLHSDDIEILHKIANTLGVGKVRLDNKRNSAFFVVSSLNDIIQIILPIFEEFPLQTSKYLDFICFSKAAKIKLNTRGSGSRIKISQTDLTIIKELRASMNTGRVKLKVSQLYNLTNRVSINMWWLLGFVEGEGTFGYKHLIPYFQIAQHKKNLFVLKAIESFLLKLPLQNTEGNQVFNIHFALNTKTDVYSMSVLSIDALFNYIVPYFMSMSFNTRKLLDFKYWVISVIMHKYGYYYLPEGKKLALQISSATNKFRYNSTVNNIELPSDDSISKLLALPAPFDISRGLTHFELVREFTINKGGRKGFTVHIYDRETEGGKELTGSPFSTYGSGHVALGLRAGSRVIGRYIDTGKAYKSKYIFTSVPLSKDEIS